MRDLYLKIITNNDEPHNIFTVCVKKFIHKYMKLKNKKSVMKQGKKKNMC